MDSGILDVLPVQATLIPKILFKLLLNKTDHGQPAGMGTEERACGQRSGDTWQGTGKASQDGAWVASSFFGSNQRNL